MNKLRQEVMSIIGIYEITKLTKHFKNKGYNLNFHGDKFSFYIETYDETFYFDNKPLELYLDKEIKELLELLKMACGNNCGYIIPYGFVPEKGCKIHDN